jgi:hypothetical protein
MDREPAELQATQRASIAPTPIQVTSRRDTGPFFTEPNRIGVEPRGKLQRRNSSPPGSPRLFDSRPSLCKGDAIDRHVYAEVALSEPALRSADQGVIMDRTLTEQQAPRAMALFLTLFNEHDRPASRPVVQRSRNAGVRRRRLSALTVALRDAVVMFESRPTPQVVPCSARIST